MNIIVRKMFVGAAIAASAFLFKPTESIAQSPTSIPSPTPNLAAEKRERMNQINTTSRRFEVSRGTSLYGFTRRGSVYYYDTIRNFYRKPTRDEAEILETDPEDLTRYASFLKTGKSGIVKLFQDTGCSDYSIIVDASEECLRFSMPGAGASFSFRTGNYRIWRLSDLTYFGEEFQSLGVLLHGIIVNIGDVPIENVTLKTEGLSFLVSFQPADEFHKAKQIDQDFVKGVEADGFHYARSAVLEENRTFVMRSIAYRGTVFRVFQGITYNELDFDTRKDIFVAFRIVRRDGESVTIVWKELARKDSPKIKIPPKSDDN